MRLKKLRPAYQSMNAGQMVNPDDPEGGQGLEVREHEDAALLRTIDYVTTCALSVEDGAPALGFSDAFGFRHAFKRWTGMTPSEYRRKTGPPAELIGPAA